MGTARKLLQSRKFIVMILGMLGAIGARLGLPEDVSEQVAMTVVVLAGTYVGAQGMADFGKERKGAEDVDSPVSGGTPGDGASD